jgi:peptidoglycan/xylan/chitin deacetylase (PgdA/CDA1 family)
VILPIVSGLGAFVVAGYNTMSPTSQLYGQTFIGEGRGSKRLCLTFDDGPNDPHTFQLLEVLAKHNTKVTFFVVGKYVKQRSDIVRQVVEAGHEVGNHTFAHPNLIFRSAAQTCAEISACDAVIGDATGVETTLFRPPFGGRRPSNLRAIRESGKKPVMWSVSGYDWNAASPNQIVDKVAQQVRGGDVILLHDGGHKGFGINRALTVQATDEIIRRYAGEGYSFVTVSEMMKTSGR